MSGNTFFAGRGAPAAQRFDAQLLPALQLQVRKQLRTLGRECREIELRACRLVDEQKPPLMVLHRDPDWKLADGVVQIGDRQRRIRRVVTWARLCNRLIGLFLGQDTNLVAIRMPFRAPMGGPSQVPFSVPLSRSLKQRRREGQVNPSLAPRNLRFFRGLCLDDPISAIVHGLVALTACADHDAHVCDCHSRSNVTFTVVPSSET